MSAISRKQDAEVLTLEINRPEKMNALTRAMYAELAEALKSASEDFSIRTLVICGAGENFCAGNDIFDFMSDPPSGADSEVFQFLNELQNFPKPIVAVVQGNAVGIGTTMLLHCDVVYATTTAKFSMPFVTLGLVPEAGSSYLFPQLVGYQRAAKIFLSGESFSAHEAKEMGLVLEVSDQASEIAVAMAKKIASQPPTSVINTKALLKSRSHDAVSAVMKVEGELFRLALQSEEAMQAFMKFQEKRERK
ncbi:MAG: enoyl-CoA hydratase [Actinomycetes bacterium]|jgi:enoyl-CoA hydratase/carnithine racemase